MILMLMIKLKKISDIIAADIIGIYLINYSSFFKLWGSRSLGNQVKIKGSMVDRLINYLIFISHKPKSF